MSDFLRLAAAFDVMLRDLEMKLAAKAAAVAAHQADLAELRRFLDRPEMMSAAGYSEGLQRVVRMELVLKSLEGDLSLLRAEHGQTKGRRDKCMSRARQQEAVMRRQLEERALVDMVSLNARASLAQSAGD